MVSISEGLRFKKKLSIEAWALTGTKMEESVSTGWEKNSMVHGLEIIKSENEKACSKRPGIEIELTIGSGAEQRSVMLSLVEAKCVWNDLSNLFGKRNACSEDFPSDSWTWTTGRNKR